MLIEEKVKRCIKKIKKVGVGVCLEGEYRAMTQGICEILWLKRILEELQLPMTLPMKLYYDNKVAISIS